MPLSEAWAKAAAESLTNTAFNAGVSDAATAQGRYRVWLSVLLSTTRPAHRAAHGTTKPPGVPFEIGGELLMHPGDPAGSIENTINCRCIVVPSDDRSNIETALAPEEIEEFLDAQAGAWAKDSKAFLARGSRCAPLRPR